MKHSDFHIGQEIEATVRGKICYVGASSPYIEIEAPNKAIHTLITDGADVNIRLIVPPLQIGKVFDNGTDLWVVAHPVQGTMMINLSNPTKWTLPSEFFLKNPGATKVN